MMEEQEKSVENAVTALNNKHLHIGFTGIWMKVQLPNVQARSDSDEEPVALFCFISCHVTTTCLYNRNHLKLSFLWCYHPYKCCTRGVQVTAGLFIVQNN